MADESKDIKFYEESYKKLLEDPNFEKLELELQKPNSFSILGISRKETLHSNFLAWLLDPNTLHGLGNRFLIRVLHDLAMKENNLNIFDINKLNFSSAEIKREVPVSFQDKDGSIDILIIFGDEEDKTVICIENKIDTEDAEGQLEKYGEYIKEVFENEGYKTVLVYLTPDGSNPNYIGKTKWIKYSYTEIIKHLENIQDAITDTRIKTYILDYLSTLKIEIMGTQNKTQELADKIYINNLEIFKFVFEHKTNDLNKLLYWMDYEWAIEYANKLVSLLHDVDDNIKADLGFAKNYISIKRNRKMCYQLMSPTKQHNCSMEFIFDKDKEGKDMYGLIEDLLIDTEFKYFGKDKYFKLFEVNTLIDNHPNILQEIHKLRFNIK